MKTWEIVRQLGEGGFGTVSKAVDTQTGQPVALKALRPELAENDILRRFFLQEPRIAQRLPGTTHVFGIYETRQGAPFYTMDLLQGETLADRAEQARGHRLPPEEVVPILSDVLGTLEAAHDRGIVHRDVKPDNVFLTRDGHTKLLDFGIAATPRGPKWPPGEASGTPGYAAPEQAAGARPDPRMDVWGAGATAYDALTGHPPARRGWLSPCPVPPVRGVPRALSAVVGKALACNPAERYPDAGAMRAALEPVREELEDEIVTRRIVSALSSGAWPTLHLPPPPPLPHALPVLPSRASGTTPGQRSPRRPPASAPTTGTAGTRDRSAGRSGGRSSGGRFPSSPPRSPSPRASGSRRTPRRPT